MIIDGNILHDQVGRVGRCNMFDECGVHFLGNFKFHKFISWLEEVKPQGSG